MKPLEVQMPGLETEESAVVLANWAAEQFGLNEDQRNNLFGKAHTMLWAFEDEAKNQGSTIAAGLLKKIADTGDHAGTFGGEEMEACALSIMELWEPDCDDTCICLACKCGGEFKPTGMVRTSYPCYYDYRCTGCGLFKSVKGGRKR